ncbi:hypothetical protein HK097_007644 [Rhizophlyctis rosea]|uniref:Uncharacterized protein n=1 Tax=Rhizophlyctis rosea TaxID=64517 RepID=A0AAD5X533_9FUNG|nr:hypothetical protein HK097_007644 [Rhizophlyctis rosea]
MAFPPNETYRRYIVSYLMGVAVISPVTIAGVYEQLLQKLEEHGIFQLCLLESSQKFSLNLSPFGLQSVSELLLDWLKSFWNAHIQLFADKSYATFAFLERLLSSRGAAWSGAMALLQLLLLPLEVPQREVIQKHRAANSEQVATPALSSLRLHQIELCDLLVQRLAANNVHTSSFIAAMLEVCGMGFERANAEIILRRLVWQFRRSTAAAGNFCEVLVRLRDGFEGLHPDVYSQTLEKIVTEAATDTSAIPSDALYNIAILVAHEHEQRSVNMQKVANQPDSSSEQKPELDEQAVKPRLAKLWMKLHQTALKADSGSFGGAVRLWGSVSAELANRPFDERYRMLQATLDALWHFIRSNWATKSLSNDELRDIRIDLKRLVVQASQSVDEVGVTLDVAFSLRSWRANKWLRSEEAKENNTNGKEEDLQKAALTDRKEMTMVFAMSPKFLADVFGDCIRGKLAFLAHIPPATNSLLSAEQPNGRAGFAKFLSNRFDALPTTASYQSLLPTMLHKSKLGQGLRVPERDDIIWKEFRELPILWDFLEIASEDKVIFGTLLTILRPLLAMSVAFWHGQLRRRSDHRHKIRSDHQYEIEAAATLLRIIGKSKAFPVPFRCVHIVVKRLPEEAIRDVLWRTLDEMIILECSGAFSSTEDEKQQLMQDTASKRERNLTCLQRVLMQNYSVVGVDMAMFHPDGVGGGS